MTFTPWGLFILFSSPRAFFDMATFRIKQTKEQSTLLRDDTPIMVIEHSDVGEARDKVRMLLLDEAQEQTGPGDVLELAKSPLH